MSDAPTPPVPPNADTAQATTQHGGAADPPKKPRRVFRKIAISALVLMVFGALGLGGAEYYTARPDFCGTCHVMDPYYISWSNDKHGPELYVKCIDCHYAPGEKYTIMAKFKGLSQVASYFSGRYGAARPRAHVANASCLVSGCHGDGAFRDKKLLIGEAHTEQRLVNDVMIDVERTPTVTFMHSKHLDPSDRLADVEAQIAAVSRRLKDRLPPTDFDDVLRTAKSIETADARLTSMAMLLSKKNAKDCTADATELMSLEHMRIRLTQLNELNCTACHTYDATSNNHFAVSLSSCYTCHFTNQEFNRDTGRCLNCHEAPTRQFIVHGTPSTTPGSSAAMMDHREIIERGIDCASCHFDVIQGDTLVSARDCERCHDQNVYLKEFENRNTDTVERYHRVHVAGQRAHCLDCHRVVRHELIEPAATTASADFLRPVLNDCQHCHPKHHESQVEMLMGVGGSGPLHPMPNAMFGSRLNCRGCHSQAGSDFKGDPLITATKATCIACHSSDYDQLFDQWMSEIASYQKEAEAGLARADAKLSEWRSAGREVPEEMISLVEQARENLRFVNSANGVHNKNYAIQLLDLSIRDLDRVVMRLSE